MKTHLHKLAVDLSYSAKENNIGVEVEWIPRSRNEKADYVSKVFNYDDWRDKDCYYWHYGAGPLFYGQVHVFNHSSRSLGLQFHPNMSWLYSLKIGHLKISGLRKLAVSAFACRSSQSSLEDGTIF